MRHTPAPHQAPPPPALGARVEDLDRDVDGPADDGAALAVRRARPLAGDQEGVGGRGGLGAVLGGDQAEGEEEEEGGGPHCVKERGREKKRRAKKKSESGPLDLLAWPRCSLALSRRARGGAPAAAPGRPCAVP